MYQGGDLVGKILPINDVVERIDYVKEFVKNYSGIDVSAYLSRICSLALVTLNTDLHFHNMGIVFDNNTGRFREVPVFDNGRSLLSDGNTFYYESMEENIAHAICQPFSSNFELQAVHAGLSLEIDYDRFDKLTSDLEETRALQVLRYQLYRYEKEYRKK